MNLASYIFLGLFSGVSIIELFFAFLEKEKERKIIKPFCLIFLAIMVMVTRIDAVFIYMGCFFGAIGDLFLIKKENKFNFAIGTVAFFIGHILYISELVFIILPIFTATKNLNIEFFVITISIILGASLLGIPLSYKISKSRLLAVFGSFYMIILLSVSGLAIYSMCIGLINYIYILLIGGLVFFSSDVILTYTSFVKDIKRRDFYIMFTYLTGQLLIVLGLLLTYIELTL